MEIINIVMSCHDFGQNGPPGVLISNFVICHFACWSGANANILMTLRPNGIGGKLKIKFRPGQGGDKRRFA